MYHVVYTDTLPAWITENLFHYTNEQSKYSIKPEDYCTKPLFLEDKETNLSLNNFFFYMFSFVGRWQCLTRKELSVLSIEDAATLSSSGYCEIPRSLSGPALEACPVISKKTVAYFESFLGAGRTAPFSRILKDPWLDSRVEKFYASAMTRLSKVADKGFLKYIERKMAAWFWRFPPKNDPDKVEKTQEGHNGTGAVPADDCVKHDGEGEALQLSGDEASGDGRGPRAASGMWQHLLWCVH
jgi:hypothetical protein